LKFDQMMQAIANARTKKAFPMPQFIRINPKNLQDLMLEANTMYHVEFPVTAEYIKEVSIGGMLFMPDHKVQEGTLELVEPVVVEVKE